MTLLDVVGVVFAAICAFEIYRAVTRQETRIPPNGMRVAKAEHPVLFRISLGGWGAALIVTAAILWDRL